MPGSIVSLAVDGNDEAWVAWEDLRGDEPLIRLARISPDGTVTTVEDAAGRGRGPRLAAYEGRLALAWVDSGRIRVMTVRSPA